MRGADRSGLDRYRRVLLSLIAGAGAFLAVFAVHRAATGRWYHAFLAVCVGVYLFFLWRGYRAEEVRSQD